jgi:hypothetical protein
LWAKNMRTHVASGGVDVDNFIIFYEHLKFLINKSI